MSYAKLGAKTLSSIFFRLNIEIPNLIRHTLEIATALSYVDCPPINVIETRSVAHVLSESRNSQ